MIIVVTNRKGGSTKSSVAAGLAGCYANGQRGLLVELDSQGDSSASFNVSDTGEALADALAGRISLEQAIVSTELGVDVAPAGEALGYVANQVGPDAVRQAVESVRGRRYNWIIVDCPPGLSPLVLSAWRASQDATALVPVDGPAALRAVRRLTNAWEDEGLDAARMRIILTRHVDRHILDRELARQARELYGQSVLETTIRESVVVRESAAWRTPLVLYAPTHPVTEDMRRLAREVAHG